MSDQKTIIIDDDPTGCQTVHGVIVLLAWTLDSLRKALNDSDVVFLITNSRSLSEKDAIAVNREIASLIKSISGEFTIRIISRGDSTLRGHFFAETKAILDECPDIDAVVFCPFFYEGGRITKNNIHYVVTNGIAQPAHETEFSKDPDFPFNTSHLPAYVLEKSYGYWREYDILTVDLEMIRNHGVYPVYQLLNKVQGKQIIIVNAENYHDLEVFSEAALQAEKAGKKFLYRSAASLVKAITGIQSIPFYKPLRPFSKGLVIAGSFVNKTTEQLRYLIQQMKIEPVVVYIERIVGDYENYQQEITVEIERRLALGELPVVYTQRNFERDPNSTQSTNPPVRISDFLCGVVSSIKVPLEFIIAKGGITSFDIAKKGLRVKSARVLGQVIKGVPVWETDNDLSDQLIYIVFPGNVGNNESIYEVVNNLTIA